MLRALPRSVYVGDWAETLPSGASVASTAAMVPARRESGRVAGLHISRCISVVSLVSRVIEAVGLKRERLKRFSFSCTE